MGARAAAARLEPVSAWFARPWPLLLAGAALLATSAAAQPADPAQAGALATLLKWLPLVFLGFLFNVLVGVLAMALGTLAGLPLGLTQMAGLRPVRAAGWAVIQLLRNAPWLVLLFYVMFLLPFELHLFGLTIPLPAWAKAWSASLCPCQPTSPRSCAVGCSRSPAPSGRAPKASPSRGGRPCSWSSCRRHSGACCRPG